MNPEVNIALNILRVENVLAIYKLGLKALTKQLNFNRFFRNCKKMNLKVRKNPYFTWINNLTLNI